MKLKDISESLAIARQNKHTEIRERYKFDTHQAEIMCMFADQHNGIEIKKYKYNDLKKGDRVVMLGIPGISNNTRTGVIMENKRGGITRMVKIDEENGYFGDIGSVYIDEIVAHINDNGEYVILSPTDTERKNMAKTRSLADKMFGEA